MYSVKEIFTTIQGEGAQAGRVSVFCRFSGCNLWSGRESDRDSAICKFCDTDFVGVDGEGGGKFNTATELAKSILNHWLTMNSSLARRYVVLTGGEPLLQVDNALIDALHACDFEIAIETNGTLPIPKGIDWVCVSPKVGSNLIVLQGDELKLVVPQTSVTETVEYLKKFEKMNFKNFFVQPMDNLNSVNNIAVALDIVKQRPIWRMSIQTHKLLGIK
jgi:7-carboxy-7-deazaguanine synthase (Cx14CxxC type)